MDTNNNIEKEAVKMNSAEEKAIVEQSTESKAIDTLKGQEPATMNSEVAEAADPVAIEVQDMASLIPMDYRSILGTSKEMQAIEEAKLFSPVIGMAHIINRANGKLYARVLADKDGARTIAFRQQYDDGGYSVEYKIKQEDLLIIVGSSDDQDPLFAREAKACKKRFIREYLSKCDGRKGLNPSEVISVLMESLTTLPVVSEYHEVSKQEFYNRVIEALHGLAGSPMEHSRRKGYIILGDNELCHICKELEMSKKKLLARLKLEGFLYLTDSCVGYQVKVPYSLGEDGTVNYQWGYCLYDLEYFARKKNPEKYGRAEELEAPLTVIKEL